MTDIQKMYADELTDAQAALFNSRELALALDSGDIDEVEAMLDALFDELDPI